jgi:hypothetical protein
VKLRIKKNSLRLRVSRSELDCLMAGDRIEETIQFARDPEAFLTYSMESATGIPSTTVRYCQHRIAVVLADHDLSTWNKASQVGIYKSIDLGTDDPLELIIEKDFACLNGSDEENQDTFANPHEGAAC